MDDLGEKKLTRGEFVTVAGLTAGAMALAACLPKPGTKSSVLEAGSGYTPNFEAIDNPNTFCDEIKNCLYKHDVSEGVCLVVDGTQVLEARKGKNRFSYNIESVIKVAIVAEIEKRWPDIVTKDDSVDILHKSRSSAGLLRRTPLASLITSEESPADIPKNNEKMIRELLKDTKAKLTSTPGNLDLEVDLYDYCSYVISSQFSQDMKNAMRQMPDTKDNSGVAESLGAGLAPQSLEDNPIYFKFGAADLGVPPFNHLDLAYLIFTDEGKTVFGYVRGKNYEDTVNVVKSVAKIMGAYVKNSRDNNS